MLKKVLIIFSICLLAGVGYFSYEKLLADRDLSVWSFVPGNSLLIYEHSNLPKSLEKIEDAATWNALRLIPVVQQLENELSALDSALNTENLLNVLLENSPVLVSVHLTGKDALDLLLILKVNNIKQQNVLNRLQSAYLEGGYTRKVRKYLDYDITDMIAPDGSSYTFIFHKNYFIGSKTAYIVEDAIRTFNDVDIMSFQLNSLPLFRLTKLKNDEGNLYLNMSQAVRFVQAFGSSTQLPDLADYAFLDLSLTDEAINMDGFTFASRGEFLDQFRNVTASTFDLAEIVSNNDAILSHYSFTDPLLLASQINSYAMTDEIAGTKSFLLNTYDFDVDHSFHLMDEEMALGVQLSGTEIFKTFYMEVKDPEDALAFYKGVAERESRVLEIEMFRDTLQSYIIYKLNAQEFPMTLLGEDARGFEECYFTAYRNFLLFSNSLPNLKEKLEDIATENTWLKSLRKIRFLEKTNRESSFSYYVHIPSVWGSIVNQLDPKWKSPALSNDFIFKSFENIAFQFSHVDDKFFTNIVLDFPENKITKSLKADRVNTITLAYPIRTKPFLVKNHVDGSMETVIQDSLNNLYLIDKNFEVLWNIGLDEQVIGDIEQLDIYRNNKLQLVFITPKAIHVVDRNGNYVDGFPVNIPGADQLDGLSLIDYDGSRRYRFAIQDNRGRVFLTNEKGTPLSGWDPKTLESPLSDLLKHYRIGGTDLILAQSEKGMIHSFSRRAREFPGFPIDVREKILSPYHVKVGSRFNTSSYHTITESGKLIGFDMKGTLLRREQLMKPSADTDFEIISEVSGKGFIILRKTAGKYEVLDENGDLLFTKDYLREDGFFAQYYELSSSKSYIVIGNPSDGFVYLYDLNGRLITNRPLKGSQPVSMIYSGSKDEHQVFIVSNKELVHYQIN